MVGGAGVGEGLTWLLYKHHSKPLSAAKSAPTEFLTSVIILIFGIKIAPKPREIEIKIPKIMTVKIMMTPFCLFGLTIFSR